MNSTEKPSEHSSPATDAELFQRYLEKQDQPALTELLEKHSTLIMSVCIQVLRNQSDAEDAFQNTVISLVKKAHQIKQPNFVVSWLYRVAQNESLILLRLRKRNQAQPLMEQADQLEHSAASEENSAELIVLHEELSQLPDKYRGPLVLCYLEGKSRHEAARELNISLNRIKGCLESGRKQLRKRLLTRGVAIATVLAARAIQKGVFTGEFSVHLLMRLSIEWIALLDYSIL